MKFWIKPFTLICFLVVSQLSILTAQNDSLEKAFVVKKDGLFKYATDKLGNASSIDERVELTTVLEVLKKDIPDLIVAEFENPELSFKQGLIDDDKKLIITGIKAISKSLARNQYDEPRLVTISLKDVLEEILLNEKDNLLYLVIGKRSSGLGQCLSIFNKNFSDDFEFDDEFLELLIMHIILEQLHPE